MPDLTDFLSLKAFADYNKHALQSQSTFFKELDFKFLGLQT